MSGLRYLSDAALINWGARLIRACRACEVAGYGDREDLSRRLELFAAEALRRGYSCEATLVATSNYQLATLA